MNLVVHATMNIKHRANFRYRTWSRSSRLLKKSLVLHHSDMFAWCDFYIPVYHMISIYRILHIFYFYCNRMMFFYFSLKPWKSDIPISDYFKLNRTLSTYQVLLDNFNFKKIINTTIFCLNRIVGRVGYVTHGTLVLFQ